jgi:hypothetical protein
MDAASFTHMLRRLTPADFHFIGAAVDVHAASAADEVEAWRLTLSVDRALRRSRRSREAAHAASKATHAVLLAAEDVPGIHLPDAQVTMVARAAAEVARALVAGEEARYEAEALLVPFASLIGAATAA